MLLKLVIGAIFCQIALSATIRRRMDEGQCGYEACNPIKEGLINVHIVPHTHDDVGWLKTLDQYYYGANNSIQDVGVQYILDSVVDELQKDPSRKFIYVETAFFWKWWLDQDDVVREKTQQLINNGQLEFIGGAWSMNDEAATHYHSTVDQFTWGLRKLNETFGDCARPKIGWQIDPFGHSREMASIFVQLGFDGVILGRVDYQDRSYRLDTQTSEMIWQGSNSLESSNIFTGILYSMYGAPSGFCFDLTMCNDEPLVANPKSPLYNIDRKVTDFFNYLSTLANAYTTSNLIIPMGSDFTYQDANTWYKNLDILIKYANQQQASGSKYNLLYSTPSCYVKAVHDSQQTFEVKTDDFFPYASDSNAYWTGYFTSRPTLKRFEREGNNFLQVCKQLHVLSDLNEDSEVKLDYLREAMGVMQHHDAITGTEKQHVAEDYARILYEGFDECEIIVNDALRKLIGKNQDPPPEISINNCLLANVSSCPVSEEEETFVVTVYNPLSRPVTKYVRLPVLGEAYSVLDPQGNSLPVQLLPIPEPILKIPGRNSQAKVELIFQAADIAPLGFKSYYVKKEAGSLVTQAVNIDRLQSDHATFKVETETGLLTEVTMNDKTINITQEFLYYEGYVGENNGAGDRSSGAYVFRPLPNQAAKQISPKTEYKIFQGSLVSEVQQIFNEWTSQTIRIYNQENFVEFDWVIGPIPDNAANGKEVITRFSTGLKTQETFYTDSNGREMIKRVRNFRPTWELDLQEPVAGNYYPITSKIVMVDEEADVEVAVLNDRAQGGSSLEDGNMEIMIHRTCLHDDAFGVGEALNEKAFGEGLVARGSHYLVIGPHSNNNNVSTAAQERDIAQRKLLSAWTFLSPTKDTFEEYKSKYALEFAGLTRSLPNNVQILTLEPWLDSSLLLRLEHILEKSEDSTLSQPVTVDLNDLFAQSKITSIKETTLAANQWLEDNARLQFNGIENSKKDTSIKAIDDLQITLNPMQIRTFVIEIMKN